jgi:hypothetical protein
MEGFIVAEDQIGYLLEHEERIQPRDVINYAHSENKAGLTFLACNLYGLRFEQVALTEDIFDQLLEPMRKYPQVFECVCRHATSALKQRIIEMAREVPHGAKALYKSSIRGPEDIQRIHAFSPELAEILIVEDHFEDGINEFVDWAIEKVTKPGVLVHLVSKYDKHFGGFETVVTKIANRVPEIFQYFGDRTIHASISLAEQVILHGYGRKLAVWGLAVSHPEFIKRYAIDLEISKEDYLALYSPPHSALGIILALDKDVDERILVKYTLRSATPLERVAGYLERRSQEYRDSFQRFYEILS